MAYFNPEVLQSALKDGWIEAPLSGGQQLYFNRGVVLANKIYQAIARGDGLDVEAIALAVDINKNTASTYLRWLVSVELISTERAAVTARIVYHAKRLSPDS